MTRQFCNRKSAHWLMCCWCWCCCPRDPVTGASAPGDTGPLPTGPCRERTGRVHRNRRWLSGFVGWQGTRIKMAESLGPHAAPGAVWRTCLPDLVPVWCARRRECPLLSWAKATSSRLVPNGLGASTYTRRVRSWEGSGPWPIERSPEPGAVPQKHRPVGGQ